MDLSTGYGTTRVEALVFFVRSGPGKPNQRKVSSHELLAGAFRNKSSRFVMCVCFLKEKHQNSKKGEVHELFVWALSLVWFAGATPDFGLLGGVTAGSASKERNQMGEPGFCEICALLGRAPVYHWQRYPF